MEKLKVLFPLQRLNCAIRVLEVPATGEQTRIEIRYTVKHHHHRDNLYKHNFFNSINMLLPIPSYETQMAQTQLFKNRCYWINLGFIYVKQNNTPLLKCRNFSGLKRNLMLRDDT